MPVKCFYVGNKLFSLTGVRLGSSALQETWHDLLFTHFNHLTFTLFNSHLVTLEQFALAVQECQVKEDQALLKKVCVKKNRFPFICSRYLTPLCSSSDSLHRVYGKFSQTSATNKHHKQLFVPTIDSSGLCDLSSWVVEKNNNSEKLCWPDKNFGCVSVQCWGNKGLDSICSSHPVCRTHVPSSFTVMHY